MQGGLRRCGLTPALAPRMPVIEASDVYRGSVSEEVCRGGTEVSAKNTCDEEKRLCEKELRWPRWKEQISKGEEQKRKGDRWTLEDK